jgi:hypothetical protein
MMVSMNSSSFFVSYFESIPAITIDLNLISSPFGNEVSPFPGVVTSGQDFTSAASDHTCHCLILFRFLSNGRVVARATEKHALLDIKATWRPFLQDIQSKYHHIFVNVTKLSAFELKLSGHLLSLDQNPGHCPSSLPTKNISPKESRIDDVKTGHPTVHIPGLHTRTCIQRKKLRVMSISPVPSGERCSNR